MQYETIVGLEVHVELSTRTKIFCGCGTVFGAPPNTNVCPVCLALPGSLPVLNREAVRYAILAGLALNCTINSRTVFDRKNYFYPDLPKAYQISQLYYPLCQNGYLEIETENGTKRISIREIHLEEDAGKLLHDPWEDKSNIDFNRCGVPLIEIVTNPDFDNAAEVVLFLEKLRETLVYLNISDCKMQEGSMRADINLSVRQMGSKELGVRTEMKNMNSFKAIYRAIEFESKRQIEIVSHGEKIIQETRRWDDNKDASYAMRTKEDAHDYRYFPDPDLPALELSEEWINEINKSIPETAAQKRERFITELELTPNDALVLTAEKPLCDLFDAVNSICGKPKEVANQIIVEVMRLMKEHGQSASEAASRVKPESLAALINKIADGSINRTIGKDVLNEIFVNQTDPLEYIKLKNLSMIEDTCIVEAAIAHVFEENEKSVTDYLSGKQKALARLVGQTMKRLEGKANPTVVTEILLRKLTELADTWNRP